MKISFLTTDIDHPQIQYINSWFSYNKSAHELLLTDNIDDLIGGDVLILVACSKILTPKTRNLFNHTLVLHSSDLPKGRGWSPHIWEILRGSTELTCSILEAEDSVDTGKIWKKIAVNVPKYTLLNEIYDLVFKTENKLIDFIVENYKVIIPKKQNDKVEATYYKKRSPEMNEINVDCSIKSQFNLLRVSDPDRYPSFFHMHGKKYKLIVERYD